MNLNSKNQPENYIHFKSQKLLKINPPPSFSPIEDQKNDFEQINQRVNRRINNFKKIHNQNKKEQEDYELKQNIANFYRNPFQYMEFLAKNHFIQQAKTLENLEIKKEMTDNFRKLCYQIEDHIQKFTTNEEMKLKKLQREVESKLKGGILPLNNDINDDKKNLNLNYNNDELNSSPVNMKDEELMRRIFGNFSYQQSPFDGIITTGNATNFVINKNISNLNEDNLYLNALSCLKGDKIVPPKNKFISVKEINLNDINQKKIVDTQNISDLKNKMKIPQKVKENDINEKKIKNKMNNIKKNEQKNLEELISYSNNYIKNMEQYQKEKEMLLDALKKKLNHDFEENAIKLAMNKLTVCEKNLNEINLEYNKVPENKLIDWEEKKEILEKEFINTQNMVDNFLNGSSKVKFNNKNKNISNSAKNKKRRTNSALPFKNKTFQNYKFK